jgi:putative ABC transport system permease protein
VSIALREPPDLTADAGGFVARRAVVRWAMRLFRREWRQQLLVLGLLTVAVAATIWGVAVVTNTQLQNPNYATFGTAAAQVTLPGSDPHLAADIAAIQRRWGPADVIENKDLTTGTTQSEYLRAEDPHGRYNEPMLGLVSGGYPSGPGQVALTSRVAALYGAHVGGTWRAAGGPSGQSSHNTLLLLGGPVAVVVGIFLLAPLAISLLSAGAGPRLPVAIRIALRDLVRYRARSGAALAATTFAVFLATAICIVASTQFESPLNPAGPNLSSSQLIFYTQPPIGGGPVNQLSQAQLASLGRQVDSYAAGLHAQPVLPLETAGAILYQQSTQQHQSFSGPVPVVVHFTGTLYVATPRLLATYGIKASQISPGSDILTVRPGMAGLPHLFISWDGSGQGSGPLASPVIQTIGGLPSGTSAPNTVITEQAVSRYHLTLSLNGWLIQAPAPLTPAQINTARQLALTDGVTVEAQAGALRLGEISDGATALGIVIALGVLAASVGLIRSETARDLRTLTATGASATTRRTITAATAAALGLLGAILGMAGAVIACLAWAHSNLSAMFGDVPLTDVLILLIGLPLIAAVAGWLLAGREPPLIARQPIE